ncbi:MAG: DUF1924 domain-containing protein [Ectothiorhodospiraceae bacterium]|jgi:cytochrome c peroxidase|nr:DUF1924 domain-containing protein [Ectothiorhodospiraceae bacterium]
MKRVLLMIAGLAIPVFATAGVVDELQAEYRTAGAAAPSAEQGRRLWNETYVVDGERRSCTTCHDADLRKTGRHAATGKPIEPLAPSVNPVRLTDRGEVTKWLARNCKWTLGRVCTPEERGHLLEFIRTQ